MILCWNPCYSEGFAIVLGELLLHKLGNGLSRAVFVPLQPFVQITRLPGVLNLAFYSFNEVNTSGFWNFARLVWLPELVYMTRHLIAEHNIRSDHIIYKETCHLVIT